MSEIYEPAKYHRETWMTDDQWYLALFVATLVGGFHHVTGKFKAAGRGIRVSLLDGGFATVDRDILTRTVFLAHDKSVRVSLCNGGPQRVGLMLHRRLRGGSTIDSHPTLEDAVALWRSSRPIDGSKGDGRG